MNYSFKSCSLVALLIACVITLASCNKKEEEPVTPVVETGLLSFHLHNYIGENEVETYGQVWETQEGRKIALDLGQLYMSHFELVRLDGSIYSVPDSFILKVQEIESYDLTDVPAGNYKSIRFHVGLDPTVNSKPASAYSNGLLNHPEMWFGSTPQPDGYIFLNAQGKIDTTEAMTMSDANLVPFSYKIGTNARYIPASMPTKNFTVMKDAGAIIHMYVDYSKLFHSIDLTNQANLSVSTTADNANSVAAKIVSAIPSMFVYE